jgi:TolB-like protein
MSGDAVEAQHGPPDAYQGRSDAFISYASQDKALAETVCRALESAGIGCWIAPRDVTPGEFYADAIVGGINASRVMVVVLTESAIASQHVLREVERASAKRHPVVSLRIGTAPLPAGLEYFLSASHWLDGTATSIDAALPQLVQAVQRLLAAAPGASENRVGDIPRPTTDHAAHPPVARAGMGLRRLQFALIAVIALAVALLATNRHWFSNGVKTKRSPASQESASVSAGAMLAQKSVAVLPFVDMSEKHDQEYFGDGMAEEILDLLAKIPGLTVIGRTSSFQFKGKNEDLRTIGRKLNAAYLLEGSVRKSADAVRITAQLINTRTGTHEWSETYDRPIGDVLKLQDAIAAAVVREMQLAVAPGYLQARSTLTHADAYDLALRARYAYDRHDREGLTEAARLFQQALDLDPAFTDAAVWLAWTHGVQAQLLYVTPAEGFEQARRAAAIALRLNPKSAGAHAALAQIHFLYDWDWAAAAREVKQVVMLAPGSPDALFIQRGFFYVLGRFEDALIQNNALLAQDPLDPESYGNAADIQMARRDHLPEAEAAWRRVLEISPSYAFAHFYLGVVLLARGERDAALLEMQKEPDESGRQEGLALTYYALGKKAQSDNALARLLQEQTGIPAVSIAEVYAFRGQADEAFHWLERAYANRDPNLASIKGNQLLRNLASDSRFKALLRKMNFPE